jgi:hypothetical protein
MASESAPSDGETQVETVESPASNHDGAEPEATGTKKRGGFQRFVTFFVAYMLAALTVASLPFPLTVARWTPTFSFQTQSLSVYSSLLCFLLLGFVFYSRATLSRLMFGPEFNELVNAMFKDHRTLLTWLVNSVKILPGLLIVFCLTSIWWYTSQLTEALSLLRNSVALTGTSHLNQCLTADNFSDCLLTNADRLDVPNFWLLTLAYLGIFVSAELAVMLMAIKEYMQEELGYADRLLHDYFKYRAEMESVGSRSRRTP